MNASSARARETLASVASASRLARAAGPSPAAITRINRARSELLATPDRRYVARGPPRRADRRRGQGTAGRRRRARWVHLLRSGAEGRRRARAPPATLARPGCHDAVASKRARSTARPEERTNSAVGPRA